MIDKWNDIWLELNECIINEVPEKDYHKMVEVIIGYMGWSKAKKEIHHKKRFPSGHSYVEADVLIEKDGEPQWVVEVKEPKHKQTKEDLVQLFSYMRLAKLPLGLYIGEKIELFYDKDDSSDPISVFEFAIEKNSVQGGMFVNLLCKQNFTIEKAITFCEQQLLERQKKETLKQISERLTSKDGSAFIINVFKTSLLEDTKMNFTNEELDEIFAGLSLKIMNESGEEELSAATFVAETHDEPVGIGGVPMPLTLGSEKPIIFTLKQSKIKAVATLHFYRKSQRYILKAGSTIKAAHSKSCLQGHIQLRKVYFSDPEICKEQGETVLLLKDIEVPELSSPSALAIFCCGSSRNGTTSWEDANGNTYDKEWWLGKNKEVKIENTKVANDK